jgi:hypothetical protein
MWKEVAAAIAFIVVAAMVVMVVSIAIHSWSVHAHEARPVSSGSLVMGNVRLSPCGLEPGSS